MLGPQLYLGAISYKLFGASFLAPRIFTLLFAIAIAVLTPRTLASFGISTRNATLASLVLTLNALMMYLTSTFMSDMFGMLPIVFGFYACLRAFRSPSDEAASAWLAAVSLSSAILGTCRQSAWIGVVALVPVTLFAMRERRKVLMYGIAVTTASLVIILGSIRWLGHQPHVINELRASTHIRQWSLHRISDSYALFLVANAAVVLPLLLPFIVRAWKSFYLGAGVFVVVVVLRAIGLHNAVVHNTIPQFSYLSLHWFEFESGRLVLNDFSFINWGTPIPFPVLLLVDSILFFAMISFAICAVRWLQKWKAGHPERSISLWDSVWQPFNDRGLLLVLLAACFLGYALMLLPRCDMGLVDRYCIPSAFIIAAIVVLLYEADAADGIRFSVSLPASAWVATAVVFVFSILWTHDIFAAYRARLTVYDRLLARGIPAHAVENGWEFSGWTQVEEKGFVNEPRLGEHGFDSSIAGPNPCMLPYHAMVFNVMQPLYAIRPAGTPGMAVAPLPGASFRRWIYGGKPLDFVVYGCSPIVRIMVPR